MAWYNPIDWFKSPVSTDEEIALYCDNPQCKSPIEKGPIAYDREHREIYHSGECGLFANAHRVFNSRGMAIKNVGYISLDRALKLFRNGKLNQALELEKRVE